MQKRSLLPLIFVLGLLAGMALMLFALVMPRANSVQASPMPAVAPTPALPDAKVYDAVEALDTIISSVYGRVSPSVVHITSQQQTFSMFYGVVPQEGTGSGFVYDNTGHIVTNNHVVADAAQVSVLLSDGTRLPAEVVGTDPYYDLAVLHVDAPDGTLMPLELGDSNQLRVGQTVIAIGNPFGLDRTLTTGVISALGRRIETSDGSVIGQAIQTDAAINPGNSGGPLLDTHGRVVGINAAINSPSGGSVGIGFAVPVDVVKRVVPSLIKDGRYVHPSLGVKVAELGTEVRPSSNGPQHGLLIVEISAGSGAQQAGLQAAQVNIRRGQYVITGGDIITAVDNQPVETRNDLLAALEEKYRPGDKVIVTIVRDGQTINQTITLDAQ